MSTTANDAEQKTCFVVMGFGKKTDHETKRLLDLDKTYRIIIKPAVAKAGLKCVRADDVVHSGSIDELMYELLLNADVVVADLSTSNANAIYELGVRHALRPASTIVIAESQFKFPFDLSHIVIRPYPHLGEGIDAEEGAKMSDALAEAIRTLADGTKTDSPVYTFLKSLKPPSRKDEALEQRAKSKADQQVEAAVAAAEQAPVSPAAAVQTAEDLANSTLLDAALAARAADQFDVAKALLAKLRERRPKDVYVIQQLALVTYKSKKPSAEAALLEAHALMQELDPANSADPETLGLWGAIHKRLWELKQDRKYLDEALRAYERGFYLRRDSYTGINYAFLLNERASVTASDSRPDAIADFVMAGRVRQQVIERCEAALQAGVRDDKGNVDSKETFWATATLIEGYAGIGNDNKSAELIAQAKELKPEGWMLATMQTQLDRLRNLLRQQAPLLRF
jgi:tetratricopeptide (TPR) repeat protein